MSFYHFTSSDEGAPTLRGQNGDGITLLDWIIVTKGGGTQLYAGTNKAVYQLAGGSGRVLRAVHDSAISGSQQRMVIRAGTSASDVDTLVNPFPAVALETDAESTWTMSTTSDTTARSYWGIVSDTFIYLVVQAAGNNACYVGSFGDFAPAISTDAWNTWVTVNGQANNSSSYFFGLPGSFYSAAQPRMYLVADISGATKSTIASPARLSQQGSFGNLSASGLNGVVYPHPYDSKLHLCDVAITDYAAQSSTPGINAMPIRGWLPNLWQPLHASSIAATGDTFSASGYNGAATFKIASESTSAASAGAFVAFEVTDTWAPPA